MIRTIAALAALAFAHQVPHKEKVSSSLTPTGEFLKPIGRSAVIPGRPVDLAVHPNGKWLYAKDNRGLVVVDVATWKVLQELPVKGGSSHTGLLVHPQGEWLFFSNAGSSVWQAKIGPDGRVSWEGEFPLPKPKIGGEAYPTGMALADDGRTLYVCASRSNQIVKIDWWGQNPLSSFDTDIAPYDLVLSNGKLYVSCWGGKRPSSSGKTAPSSGTAVEVTESGRLNRASVAVHDLAKGTYGSVNVGLQPSELVAAPDGRVFVANANEDTVTEISADLRRTKSHVLKPDFNLPFGSAPNALALDGNRLLVACGGNNAIGVLDISASKLLGFFPTGWYPAAVQVSNGQIFIANAKGTGSRHKRPDGSMSVYDFTGTLQKVPVSALANMKAHTASVNRLNATPAIMAAMETEEEESVQAHDEPLVPLPDRPGERSSVEHVVYVIKENRTYDQVFGDIKKADGDPKLCIFGRNVTPNHHALAERFVLLDNYYCNGVNSADGHAWSTEGIATSHFERSFGGWTRSYPFGDDPISTSNAGFLWDNALRWGKTFRNYGEFNYSEPIPKGATWSQILNDWKSGANQIKFSHNIGVERLRRYSKPSYPGWNMRIPDILRADIFVKDVAAYNKAGYFPNLTILYLPQDHTSGTTPGEPTPRATVADNDLALGRCVEALSKSRYWKKMAIFVIEDDPQNGFDHIDGHRSICLVISPFSQTGKVVKNFYNQTSVLASMQRMLGVPPMNQMDARAPIMYDCFVDKPNLRPYTAVSNRVPLDELNPPRTALKGEALKWAEVSAKLPRHKPDLMNLEEATLFNQALWYSVHGGLKRYPMDWSGAHGKGLKKKGLVFVGEGDD